MDRNDIGWRGNFTAVTTPFKQYGEVDEALFQQNIDLLIQEGIDGIIPSGSTGEVSSLTDAERVRLYELTVEVVAGRVPIVAGTAHVNTDMAVALSKKAKAIGADGLMLTPPHYALPNKREVFEHFQEVSSQVDLPILVYNNPGRVGISIPATSLAKIAKIENVVAIKESSKDFSDFVATLRLCRNEVKIFDGLSMIRGFPTAVMGADGFVSSVDSPVMGKEAVGFYEVCTSGDNEAAQKLQYKLLGLEALATRGLGTFPASVKAAMNLLGRPGGYPRKPILPLTKEEMSQLEVILENVGLMEPTASR